METESLNSLVLYYQNTGLGLAEILKRLALRIYHYPLSKCRASEDDCGEFYLFFYPRLLRTLKKFKDRGKPFEWYFNSVLHWHYKEYCSQKRREEIRWTVARNAVFWELPDPTAVYAMMPSREGSHRSIIPMDQWGRSRQATYRRRVLFLALKNAHALDDSAFSWISRLSGVEEDHLVGLVERLRANLCQRELRLHKLYLRQNKIYTKILLLQRDLIWEVDPAGKTEIALSLSRLRVKLRTLQRKIRGVKLRPSNREIAELLQIPKGTVDTSLFWFRRQLRESVTARDAGKTPRLCA
jgi:DNA-directed RNA polymerase specialized sigma24 family protein